jgi:hypothetical protein
MKYYETSRMPDCTEQQLKEASAIMKANFPNGPAVRTVEPDRKYSYNEIASNIRPTLNEISKSLY